MDHIDNLFDLFNALNNCIKDTQAIIAANIDNTPMEVGDRVIPWDGSSVTTDIGKRMSIVHEPFISTNHWIVVSNNESTKFDSGIDVYNQDLLLAHPKTKQLIRCASRHVKHAA